MGKPISQTQINATLKAQAKYPGNLAAAARTLGLSHHAYCVRLDGLKRNGVKLVPESPATIGVLVDDSLARRGDPNSKLVASLRAELDATRAALAAATKPHFTVRQDNMSKSGKIRIVCIGDAHDSPALPDKSRFEWIGKYIRAEKPDVVVQIGDFCTLDSLSTHVPNENYSGKAKPTFIADMVSFNEALDAMQLNGIERHCTLGNHERRLYLFEERAPEAYGMMQFELQKVFEKHKWTFSPYGQITTYGGVGFVHAALNRLGKTYGGKTAENTIANDSVHDLVIGHSHTERRHRAPKIGGNNYVNIVNVGCALPDGHIEEYAQHCLTGWSWGIADFVIQHGHIQDYRFVTMQSLGERCGRKAA